MKWLCNCFLSSAAKAACEQRPACASTDAAMLDALAATHYSIAGGCTSLQDPLQLFYRMSQYRVIINIIMMLMLCVIEFLYYLRLLMYRSS